MITHDRYKVALEGLGRDVESFEREVPALARKNLRVLDVALLAKKMGFSTHTLMHCLARN